MKAGYFIASKELIAAYWRDIEPSLSKVFTEVCRKEIGSGMVEIHGESELFEMKEEGATQQYQCFITKDEVGLPIFDKFVKV